MKWHCYEEKYLLRRVDGKDQPVLRYLQSPEFAVGTTELRTHDASFRPFWSSAHWRAKIWQDLGTYPSAIRIRTDAPKVTAVINGDAMSVALEVREGQTVWVLDPYARLPRVRDRVRSNRITNPVPGQ